jgi:HSP20 family protein
LYFTGSASALTVKILPPMKLARNTNALRGFGPQLDLLNTLNGGVAQAAIQVRQRRHDVLITVAAPSLDPEAFDISLDQQLRLTIAAAASPLEAIASSESLPNDLRVPLLRQQFTLPPQVDTDRIEATFSHDRLQVRLPFRATRNGDDDAPRRIEVWPVD